MPSEKAKTAEMENEDSAILVTQFLEEENIAVAGASQDRSKYGNQVVRALVEAGKRPVPINPKTDLIEGLKTFPELAASQRPVGAISIVTPPAVTEQIVQQAIELGIKKLWMQPGAESDKAIKAAQQAGIDLLHSGPCILVALRLSR